MLLLLLVMVMALLACRCDDDDDDEGEEEGDDTSSSMKAGVDDDCKMELAPGSCYDVFKYIMRGYGIRAGEGM